jgi:ankyrin repeat protein
MTRRSSLKRSHHHLKQLVEASVAEEFKLAERGLSFLVDEIDVAGTPPERLRVWATLHFLPLGSPFCCCEPSCHVPPYAEYMDRIADSLRRRMGLRQQVSLETVNIGNLVHPGAEFDDALTGRSPDTHANDIDHRDALGRTALMRAAVRGHDHVVEELLAAGASPTAVDCRGRGILEQVKPRHTWIVVLLESALSKRGVPVIQLRGC